MKKSHDFILKVINDNVFHIFAKITTITALHQYLINTVVNNYETNIWLLFLEISIILENLNKQTKNKQKLNFYSDWRLFEDK
jgi:hypothetical protein